MERNVMANPPNGTVAMLFSDIEGSTRLARSLGDGYEALLERHRTLLRTAIAEHNARSPEVRRLHKTVTNSS
jgi:class 3 adenylate cyclase